ncbi:MAG: hypothetical protein ACXWUB_10040, partial [Burkholderiales bacterium]
WNIVKQLGEQVEAVYSNWYVTALGLSWGKFVEAGLLDNWKIDDVPNERLAWRTIDGSDIYNAGSVRFRPVDGGSATEVTVELLYVPPAGALGAAVAKLFGKDAGQEMSADLDAFKQLMESTSGGAASSSM